MTEPKEGFPISDNESKEAMERGGGGDRSDSDKELLTRSSKSIVPTIEAYMDRINSATKFKQTLLAHEAEQEKSAYVEMLDKIYCAITRQVGQAIHERRDLAYSYGMLLNTQDVIQAAVSAAFQCVKSDLQKRGWSPIIEEEWVVDNGDHIFLSKITCAIP